MPNVSIRSSAATQQIHFVEKIPSALPRPPPSFALESHEYHQNTFSKTQSSIHIHNSRPTVQWRTYYYIQQHHFRQAGELTYRSIIHQPTARRNVGNVALFNRKTRFVSWRIGTEKNHRKGKQKKEKERERVKNLVVVFGLFLKKFLVIRRWRVMVVVMAEKRNTYAGVLCMKKVFQDEDGVFQSG